MNLTIDDFNVIEKDGSIPYVEWSELERVFSPEQERAFSDWFQGQTCYPEGVYRHDLERYLNTLQGIPTYFD